MAGDEKTHEMYEEQKKQVFVGFYVGSAMLETQSEQDRAPVLTASAG